MWSACLNLNTNCFFVELGIKVISTFNFALKLPSIHEITVMVYMWNVMSQNFTIISTRYHLLWKRRMTKRHFHFTNDLFCELSLWCYRNFWEHREENVLIERVFGKERSLQTWKNAMSKPMWDSRAQRLHLLKDAKNVGTIQILTIRWVWRPTCSSKKKRANSMKRFGWTVINTGQQLCVIQYCVLLSRWNYRIEKPPL